MERLRGLKVLIVDDDMDARELTAVIIASAGARVGEASSGEEALEKLSTEHFDVVVSDIAMPAMDGKRLVRLLRRTGLPSQRARALAFTAFVSEADRRAALEAGFDEHLGKTADATTLVSVVADLAGRQVMRAS